MIKDKFTASGFKGENDTRLLKIDFDSTSIIKPVEK